MVLKPDPALPSAPDATAPGRRTTASLAAAVWREILLPLGVVLVLLLIAVALIEGPPLEQFLYAVF